MLDIVVQKTHKLFAFAKLFAKFFIEVSFVENGKLQCLNFVIYTKIGITILTFIRYMTFTYSCIRKIRYNI